MVLRPLLILLLAAGVLAQKPPSDLEVGRRLTALLKLDAAADIALFRSAGLERVLPLLQAVVDRGRAADATQEDWKNLHRATAGQIELCLIDNNLLLAAMYAGFQEQFYRQLDRDFVSALAASREALALQEGSGATGTLYLAHHAVGANLKGLGQTEAALSEFRIAHQTDPGVLNTMSAACQRDVILAEIALGRLDEARRDEADMARTAQSAPPAYRATALLAHSDLAIADGHYSIAVDAVNEARALVTDPLEVTIFAAEAFDELMSCVLDSMRTLSYEQSLQLAAEIDRKCSGLPINVAAFARASIRVRRRLAGDLDGVLREDNERLEKARADGDARGEIEILRSIAATYSAMHARSQQIEVLEEALALEDKLLPLSGIPESYPAAYSYLTTLNLLGNADADEGRDTEAGKRFALVLTVIGKTSAASVRQQLESIASEARLGKARVSALRSETDDARDLLTAELKLHPDSPWIALQWARLERVPGEHPRKAAELYDLAGSSFAKQADRRDEIVFRLEYARFLATDGLAVVPDSLPLAYAQVELVAAGAADLNFGDAQWQALYTRGLIAEAQGQESQAIQFYREAVGRLEHLRAGIAQESQRQAFTDSRLSQELYKHLVSLLAAANRPPEAWEYLERGKARAFLEMLHGRRFREDPVASPALIELRQIEERIAGLRAELQPVNQDLLRGAGREPAAIEAKLKTLEGEYQVARERAGASVASVRTGDAALPLALSETQKLIPRDTALIEYADLDGRMAAFIVTRNGSTLRSWPVRPGLLEKRALVLASKLRNANSGADLDESLVEVSKLVVEPIVADIPAATTHLLIVPTGQLYYVPFQALRLPDGRALVEQYSIGYLPSAGTLQFLANGNLARGKLFIGAIGDVSSEGMVPLPGTLSEAEAIASVYPGATRATGTSFTHDAAKQALIDFDEVHFATHGEFDEDAPLFSRLYTSPAAGQPSRLSLFELTSMKVRARLVVLSACKTGLGKLSGGDEIAGLNRAFLAAGAKVVVSSLWSVSDESTALLMKNFHEGLRRGMAPSAALRVAELAVRKQYPHPYYWAPFILTGAY